jgi:oligopeptide transport system substrate-binding protein
VCGVKRLALLLSVTVLGCRGGEGEYFGTTDRLGKSDTTFYTTLLDEPEYLDPGLVSDAGGHSVVMELFDGLASQHPQDLRAIQAGAVRYDRSDDNRIFRFHLRPEAKWSDGRPVVAGDYLYAWRRALAAETGARNATMLYVVKNGQAYHQGKLMVLTAAQRLAPSAGAEGGEELAAGTAVRILATTPLSVAVAPLDSPLAAEQDLYFDPATKEVPAKLSKKGGDAASATLGEPAAADVMELGGKARCNDAEDRWYRLRVGGKDGWLPGCALAEKPKQAKAALVQVHHDLPTFVPGPARAPGPTGFVPTAALHRDPNVLGVRATGDLVLEVELDKPTPYFLELTAYPTLYPVRQDVIERFAAEGDPDRWFRPENLVSNGPYVFAEHKFRYELVLERNPHHPDHDALKTHRIVWPIISSAHGVMNLYKAGEIDYIGANQSLPNEFMDRLEKFKDFTRVVYTATYWYEFNVDKPPLDDVRVRQALNMAVDKQQLIDRVVKGDQLPATHFVPPIMGSGYAEVDAADRAAGRDPFEKGAFDPERARALLVEAGYPLEQKDGGWHCKGFPPLEILYNTYEGHRVIAVALQGMWKEQLGISVQLRNEAWPVFLKNLRDGHFQIARFGWIADYNHPQTFMDVFLSYSNNNWTNWADPRFDALVDRAAAEPDGKRSIELYRQAEKIIVDAMPRMPIYFYTKSTLIKPFVKGYWDNAMNKHGVRYMWVDPAWRTDKENRPAIPALDFPEPGRIQ